MNFPLVNFDEKKISSGSKSNIPVNVRYFRHQLTIAKYIFPPKVTSLFDLFCHYSISLNSCLCSGWNKKKKIHFCFSGGRSLVRHLYAMEIKTIMCENKYTYFTLNGYYVSIFSAYLLINPFFSVYSLQKVIQQISRPAHHLLNMKTQLYWTKRSQSYTHKNAEVNDLYSASEHFGRNIIRFLLSKAFSHIKAKRSLSLCWLDIQYEVT